MVMVIKEVVPGEEMYRENLFQLFTRSVVCVMEIVGEGTEREEASNE